MGIKSSYSIFKDKYKQACESGDFDYEGLDQGPDSTLRRYVYSSKFYDGGTVLDFGCGTGLFLQHLCSIMHPTFYVGVDILQERERFIKNLGEKYNVPVNFIKISDKVKISSISRRLISIIWDINKSNKYSFGACIGVCGYPGYQTPVTINKLIRHMQALCLHGAVSIPIEHPSNTFPTYIKYISSKLVDPLKGEKIFTKVNELIVRW